MKFLGTARAGDGILRMPEGFAPPSDVTEFDVVEIDGVIVLSPTPLDRSSAEEVARLADASIEAHRRSLEGLAR